VTLALLQNAFMAAYIWWRTVSRPTTPSSRTRHHILLAVSAGAPCRDPMPSSNSDPMMTMRSEGLVKWSPHPHRRRNRPCMAVRRLPAGVIYAPPATIEKKPAVRAGVFDASCAACVGSRATRPTNIGQADRRIRARHLPSYIQALSFEGRFIRLTWHSSRRGRHPLCGLSSSIRRSRRDLELSRDYNDTFVKKSIPGK